MSDHPWWIGQTDVCMGCGEYIRITADLKVIHKKGWISMSVWQDVVFHRCPKCGMGLKTKNPES